MNIIFRYQDLKKKKTHLKKAQHQQVHQFCQQLRSQEFYMVYMDMVHKASPII